MRLKRSSAGFSLSWSICQSLGTLKGEAALAFKEEIRAGWFLALTLVSRLAILPPPLQRKIASSLWQRFLCNALRFAAGRYLVERFELVDFKNCQFSERCCMSEWFENELMHARLFIRTRIVSQPLITLPSDDVMDESVTFYSIESSISYDPVAS